jgi:hypothetical protein
MITDAIERGYHVFDFGRSTPNEGTFQFKNSGALSPRRATGSTC